MNPEPNYTSVLSDLKSLEVNSQQRAIKETVSNLPEDKKVETITDATKNLTAEQQKAVAAAVLPPPTTKTNDYIWLIVIVAFSLILVGIVAVMAIGWFRDKQFEPHFLTIFTTISAFLIGLFAQSPVNR